MGRERPIRPSEVIPRRNLPVPLFLPVRDSVRASRAVATGPHRRGRPWRSDSRSQGAGGRDSHGSRASHRSWGLHPARSPPSRRGVGVFSARLSSLRSRRIPLPDAALSRNHHADDAVRSFDVLLSELPESNRVPGAHLRLRSSLTSQGPPPISLATLLSGARKGRLTRPLFAPFCRRRHRPPNPLGPIVAEAERNETLGCGASGKVENVRLGFEVRFGS